MNKATYELMRRCLRRIDIPQATVLDVGSRDVNGTYRPLIDAHGWHYTGLDIEPGPNVDVLAEDPLHYPFADGTFDIVISGSTMEHVSAIWLWVPELVRVLRPGGFLAIVAPHACHEHRYPADYWRIMPQGMAYLLELAGLVDVRVGKSKMDVVGTGYRAP